MSGYVQIGWCVMEAIKREDGTKRIKKAINRNFFNKAAADLYVDLLTKQGREVWVSDNYGGERKEKK